MENVNMVPDMDQAYESPDRNVVNSKKLYTNKIKAHCAQAPADINPTEISVAPGYRLHKFLAVCPDKFAEGFISFLFGAEALDNFDAGQILVNKGIEVGRLLPLSLPVFF